MRSIDVLENISRDKFVLKDLNVFFECDDLLKTFKSLEDHHLLPCTMTDTGQVPLAFESPADFVLRCSKQNRVIRWSSRESPVFISLQPDKKSFLFSIKSLHEDFSFLQGILKRLIFFCITFTQVHRWDWSDLKLPLLSKVVLHPICPIGWGFAVRGQGHLRFISRRWLERGPWYVEHLVNDTTFVVLHDPETDPHTAYEQMMVSTRALVGEEGNAEDDGGFYTLPYVRNVEADDNFVYKAEGRELWVDATKRAVTPGSLKDLCIRRMPTVTAEERGFLKSVGPRVFDHLKPGNHDVERIVYSFPNRAAAEEHLHLLWLHEIECWYEDEHGTRHRLDEDYEPPVVEKPAWVADFAARVARDKAEAAKGW